METQGLREESGKRNMEGQTTNRYRRPGLFPGLLLMLIGSVVLLDHMGIISVDRLWKFWPLLLIAVGTVKLFEGCNRVLGVVLVLVGAVLLGNNLGYMRLSWADLWPLALIGAGLTLIWNKFELPKIPRTSTWTANSINEYALFGGVERRVHVNNFTGGSITAMFGGVEVDFRSADIEGEEAVMYVEAIFGGIEVTVPERWVVLWEGQNIFGGYTDETRPPLPDVPGGASKKRLILRGRAVFGGINVRS
jgi:predicted membrane protein